MALYKVHSRAPRDAYDILATNWTEINFFPAPTVVGGLDNSLKKS